MEPWTLILVTFGATMTAGGIAALVAFRRRAVEVSRRDLAAEWIERNRGAVSLRGATLIVLDDGSIECRRN